MKKIIRAAVADVLVVSAGTLVVFAVCEFFRPGFVTSHVNLSLLLLWTLGLATIETFWKRA